MAKTPAKKTPAKRPTKTPVKGTPKAKSATSKSAVLVIVESPAKAKTIEKYLGPGFEVIASKGHVRDLPERAKKQVDTEIDEDGEAVVVVVKAKRRKKGDPAVVVRKIDDVPGVNLETFEETYEVTADRKTLVKELRSKAKRAKEVWFATDLDREGEAISWHLAEVLEIDPTKAKRVVFNAITKSAIEDRRCVREHRRRQPNARRPDRPPLRPLPRGERAGVRPWTDGLRPAHRVCRSFDDRLLRSIRRGVGGEGRSLDLCVRIVAEARAGAARHRTAALAPGGDSARPPRASRSQHLSVKGRSPGPTTGAPGAACGYARHGG